METPEPEHSGQRAHGLDANLALLVPIWGLWANPFPLLSCFLICKGGWSWYQPQAKNALKYYSVSTQPPGTRRYLGEVGKLSHQDPSPIHHKWGRGGEVLPGFVEVFACVGHPTSGPKALAQGSGGHISESLFLSGQRATVRHRQCFSEPPARILAQGAYSHTPPGMGKGADRSAEGSVTSTPLQQ